MTRARDLSNLIGSGNYTSTTFTATAGQTVFTIAHTQGFIQVFMNGLLLDETTDYTSNGTAVTLTDAATAGDELEVVKYNTFSVGDAMRQSDADTRYVNASGDSMTGNLGIGDGNPTNHYGEEFRLVLREDHTATTQMCLTNATVGTGAKTQYKMIGGTGNSFAGWVLDDNNGSPYSDLSFGNAVNHLQIGLGGQQRMRIDSAGRVTLPYQPSFRANNGITSFSGGGQSFACSTVSHNIGNHYNSTNGVFTAPVTAVYHFSYAVTPLNGGVASNGSTCFRLNGSNFAQILDYAAADSSTQSITVLMNANDTMEAVGKGANNGQWGSWSANHTMFSGHMVG